MKCQKTKFKKINIMYYYYYYYYYYNNYYYYYYYCNICSSFQFKTSISSSKLRFVIEWYEADDYHFPLFGNNKIEISVDFKIKPIKH